MRKADKRKLGEERNRPYAKDSSELARRTAIVDNQVRAHRIEMEHEKLKRRKK